ncbi:hypothetical protein Cni_G21188 [Canna indica]|uniref:DUF7890 domain-containing protein n=1 Tax=Canna indica TaxID=4628 RepID=A0AAQ3QKG7_9LILI|nr:hypothetical protein Cni_G21188 [Canna indica]
MGNFLPKAVSPAKPSNKSKQGSCLHLSVPLYWFHTKVKKRTNAAIGRGRETKSPLPVGENKKESEKKGVIRVKVVLTKEEATQLLAMCARGEERMAAVKAMRRLERLQACRRQLSSCRSWRPALVSIPEDKLS